MPVYIEPSRLFEHLGSPEFTLHSKVLLKVEGEEPRVGFISQEGHNIYVLLREQKRYYLYRNDLSDEIPEDFLSMQYLT